LLVRTRSAERQASLPRARRRANVQGSFRPIKVIAPWREWDLLSREKLMAYAEKHAIPIDMKHKQGGSPYSMDANLLHISFEGRHLEDPAAEAEESMWRWTVSPEKAPDAAEYLDIEYKRGDIVAHPQPESGVTFAPRLGRDDGRVEWERRSAVEVDRMVRALQPWPGVVAPLEGVHVRLEQGVVTEGTDGAVPGAVLRHEGESVVVAAREGAYRADMITPPGRRAMAPAAFLRGRRPVSEAPTS